MTNSCIIMISSPINKDISLRIPPNYSSWETIELSYRCCQDVIARKIDGDWVECGVAAGNNLAAMCAAGRHGYGFDSFEGIPWAGPHDDQQPGMAQRPLMMEGISSGVSSHTQENVELDFKKWGIPNYTLIKGWFIDTLPHNIIGDIAVLRLDGDLYDSTMLSLLFLYPKLSVGGILIMDDWNLAGCRKAFDNFFKKRRPELIFDNGVTYWKK